MTPHLQIIPAPVSYCPEINPRALAPPVELAQLKALLSDMPGEHAPTGITADVICDLIAERFNVSRGMFFSRVRTRRVAWPRQISMYLIHELLFWPFVEIGKYFHRDHGTVMWACEVVAGQMETYPNVRAQITELQTALRIGTEGK